MYQFVDTNEVSAGAILPAEALKINGEFIENQINGYRTLSVEGREALSPELSTFETGVRDGSGLLNKRYPARTIIVKYQLIAKTAEEFREAYNKFASILNVEEAELIFNDEQDKYFIGTPSTIGSVEPGRNAVVGEFEILCTNPFKYSVVEYEATPDLEEGSILIDYNGTYKAYPVLEADFYNEEEVAEDGETETALTGNGDCGYVAFFNESEKIIQLGDPDEADTEEAYPKSQTLLNQTFKTANAWGTAAKKLWTENSGDFSAGNITETGKIGLSGISSVTTANPVTTSGTLITVWSDSDDPKFYYSVVAKTSGRTANGVKVTVTITASLKNTNSYFGRPYALKASLYIGGSWRSVTLKNASEYWRGKTGHTVNLSFTVSGLSNTTASLTGIKFKVERTDTVGGNAGKLSEKACKNLSISPYTSNETRTYALSCIDYGSGTKWHGASVKRNIPADASGETGAKNFSLSYSQKMTIGKGSKDTEQCGSFEVFLFDVNNTKKVLAGLKISKTANGKKGKIIYVVNHKDVGTAEIDLSYNSKDINTTITKAGGTVTFSISGLSSKVFRSDDIADSAAGSVGFMFLRWGTKYVLSYNGVYGVKFVKNNCNTLKDIPNKFSANDVLEADCESGKIYLNNIENASLGALGNDWEGFYLTPGLNQIGISYSDWVTAEYAPNFKVRYREVFL